MIDRQEANKVLAERLKDELVICGLGNAGFDLFHYADRSRNFYTWGNMGTAVSIGLGLALARPDDHVLVLEGDGALLMGLGGLVSIGRFAPANLVCIIWDNQILGLTGGQPSPTAAVADLAAVGQALGFASSVQANTLEEFREAYENAWSKPGPALIVAKVNNNTSGHKPPRHAAVNKYRFMRAVGSLSPDDQMAFD